MVLNGFHGGAQLACSNFNRTLALGLAIIQKNSQGEPSYVPQLVQVQHSGTLLASTSRLETLLRLTGQCSMRRCSVSQRRSRLVEWQQAWAANWRNAHGSRADFQRQSTMWYPPAEPGLYSCRAGLALLNRRPRPGRLGLLALQRRRRRQARPLAPLLHLPRALGTAAFLAALSLEVGASGCRMHQ